MRDQRYRHITNLGAHIAVIYADIFHRALPTPCQLPKLEKGKIAPARGHAHEEDSESFLSITGVV
eukprot:1160670-Pelagomonas_calceolata.AAC.7